MSLRTAGVGILATALFVAGQGNSQSPGETKFIPGSPVAAPDRVRDGDKEPKTALQNFTDFLTEVKKNNSGVLIALDPPEITAKNLPNVEAAFNAITDPKNGMKPGATNIDGNFTSQEKVRISWFVKTFARQLATFQNALGTDEGSRKAEQTMKTADLYNVRGDGGVTLAFGTRVPLTALQPTEKKSK